MTFLKKKDDPITEFKRYAVTIVFNGDQTLSYKFTNVVAVNADDAVEDMKQYVAKNGFWGTMTQDEVLPKLSAIEVNEI